jgi:hypothetical protein
MPEQSALSFNIFAGSRTRRRRSAAAPTPEVCALIMPSARQG